LPQAAAAAGTKVLLPLLLLGLLPGWQGAAV
jgi:hypothetical protein